MSAVDTSFNLTEQQKITNVPVYKYLDIDSTYRNRNNYPNQNDFVIPISYPGRDSTSATAIDPISDAIPYSGSTVPPGANVTQAGSTTTNIILDVSESVIDNYYIYSYLQIGSEFRQITYYNGTTKAATVSTAFSVPPIAGTVYYTRKNIPSIISTVAVNPPPTLNTVSIASTVTLSSTVGNYLRFTSGVNSGLIFLILSFDPTTNTVVIGTMPNVPSAGDGIEIDSFSRDNAYPLIYSGLDISNKQNSYYEIELLWLSVPNVVLGNGYGGKLDRYPYIYLQLYNEGKRLYNQPMYSNNPNSTLALFKVPVNEYFGDTSFITLKDAKTKQVVKFEPAQDLRFTLTLPDGTIIEYYNTDNLSPQEPNPVLQVNALFSLRKLT